MSRTTHPPRNHARRQATATTQGEPHQGRSRSAQFSYATAGAALGMLVCLTASGSAAEQEESLRRALQQRNQLVEQLARRVEALEREMRTAEVQERPSWMSAETTQEAAARSAPPVAVTASLDCINPGWPAPLTLPLGAEAGPLLASIPMPPAAPPSPLPPVPPVPPVPLAVVVVPSLATPVILPSMPMSNAHAATAVSRRTTAQEDGVVAADTGSHSVVVDAEQAHAAATALNATAMPDTAPSAAPVVKQAALPFLLGNQGTHAAHCMPDPERKAMIDALRRRGDAMLALGDISAARLLYERASAAGSAAATRSLGQTYDPEVLARFQVRGLRPDPVAAVKWYRRADEMSASEAARSDRDGSKDCPG